MELVVLSSESGLLYVVNYVLLNYIRSQIHKSDQLIAFDYVVSQQIIFITVYFKLMTSAYMWWHILTGVLDMSPLLASYKDTWCGQLWVLNMTTCHDRPVLYRSRRSILNINLTDFIYNWSFLWVCYLLFSC